MPATWPPSVGLFLLGAVNSVVDVAMNAHGVTVERRLGRPVMPGFHAMYSLGGTAGAVLGALAAGAGLGRTPHFLLIVLAGVAVAVPATGMLLPSRADAAGQAGSGGGRRRGALVTDLLGAWSGRTLALGVLSFCLLLAEGSVHDWAAVYLRDGVGATAGLAAARVATFTAAMTAGRLAGGRVAARLGPVTAFRSGALLACIGFGVALLVGTPWPAWPAWDCSGAACRSPSRWPSVPPDARAAPPPRRWRASPPSATWGRSSGPASSGAVAGPFGLPTALALPAVLVTGAALAARLVAPSQARPVAPPARAA